MRDKPLVDYALKLAKFSPAETKFVVLDGSEAEGKATRYSDFDVMVVKRGRLKPPGSFRGLYGVFRGRMFSGWLVDGKSFRRMYIGSDDAEFVWKRRQLQKARLLYGNPREFYRIVKAALARRWTRKRQFVVVREAYVTMVEYMGKMLNKAGQGETPELYQDAYILAENAAMLVAALNKINLDSDKSMYRQILSEAKVRPPGFERDFVTASGLAGSRRERKEVVSASRRLVRWARKKIIASFGQAECRDPGFRQLVREMKY